MKIEIRSKNEAIVEGYVNAVERDSRVLRDRNGKPFVERVRSGTFQRALNRGGSIELKKNHKTTLGSTADGCLELKEDNIGLYARARITDEKLISEARDGKLTGWSFGFNILSEEIQAPEDGTDYERHILEDIDLREVSILTGMPAYIATSITMRDEESKTLEERIVEEKAEVRERDTPEERKLGADEANRKNKIELLRITGGRKYEFEGNV